MLSADHQHPASAFDIYRSTWVVARSCATSIQLRVPLPSTKMSKSSLSGAAICQILLTIFRVTLLSSCVHIPSKALSWFIAIPLIFLQRESELGSITMI